MNTILTRPTTLCALALLATCACEEPFDPGSRVNSLRVLAVEADQPYAAPGQTVRLQALSFDPDNRPISWAWLPCASPEIGTAQGCLDFLASLDETPTPLAYGEGQDSLLIDIPANALEQLPEVLRPAAQFGVLSMACPGEIELLDPGEGTLPFRCLDAVTGRELDLHDSIVGLKRIWVREEDRNDNPIIDEVQFAGTPWPAGETRTVQACTKTSNEFEDCPSETQTEVGVRIPSRSFESGSDEFGRQFDEALVVQYYSTAGTFEAEVRVGEDAATKFVAPASSRGDTLTLWFVVHDNRGGVTWTQRQVEVQ